MSVAIGLERFLDDPATWVRANERVGLLSNPTGVDRRLHSSVDLLHRHPDITLARLYGPEHGIRGDAQAGVEVEDDVDERTGLPVTSLYAREHGSGAGAFSDIDALVIDIQDVGIRYYTYLASANSATRRASEAGARVIILDRPNPISWMGAWGNRVAPGAGSIVGLEGLPITHGASLGEMLVWLAAAEDRQSPEIVAMTGWNRSMRWHETGLPWVPPSPNLPTLNAVHLYPATCLVEGTSLSEGRGTTLPFELIGAPDVDQFELADKLNDHELMAYRFRPATFVPTFSKHQGELCRGVQIHALHGHTPEIVAFGPELVQTLSQVSGGTGRWARFGNHHFLDRLAGGPELRETIDAGGNVSALSRKWSDDAASFIEEMGPYVLYGPLIRHGDAA